MAYIYALCDPETQEVRYIGKTVSLDLRMKNHRNDKTHTRKARWLRSLAAKGLEPEVTLLADVPDAEWQEAEQYWIAHFRKLGADLTNHTDGGEGLHNPNQETRTRISQIRKAMFQEPQYRERFSRWVQSPERRAKISAALTGRKKSPAHIAKLHQNQPGRKLSDAQKQSISDGLRGNQRAKGYHHTEETLASISAKLKGNKHTSGRIMPDEEKLKRSLALKGRPKSEEHREKIRIATLKRWERFRGEKGRTKDESH